VELEVFGDTELKQSCKTGSGAGPKQALSINLSQTERRSSGGAPVSTLSFLLPAAEPALRESYMNIFSLKI
jgi:hypothetical protein